MEVGIAPVREFLANDRRIKLAMSPTLAGMIEVRLLFASVRISRVSIMKISSGIAPPKLLSCKPNSTRPGMSANDAGIWPLKRLLIRYKLKIADKK